MIEKLKQAVVKNRNAIATAGLVLVSAVSVFASGFVLGRCSGSEAETKTETKEVVKEDSRTSSETGSENMSKSDLSLIGDIKISVRSDRKIKQKRTTSTRSPDGTSTTVVEETSVDTSDNSESDLSLELKQEVSELKRDYALLQTENQKLRLSQVTTTTDPHDKWLLQVSAGTDLRLSPVIGGAVNYRVTRHVWAGIAATSRADLMGTIGVSF